MTGRISCQVDYTIPSDNRELQLRGFMQNITEYYTIPSDNRELQRVNMRGTGLFNYTIPSDNRELQQDSGTEAGTTIIPYQVITGNYN